MHMQTTHYHHELCIVMVGVTACWLIMFQVDNIINGCLYVNNSAVHFVTISTTITAPCIVDQAARCSVSLFCESLLNKSQHYAPLANLHPTTFEPQSTPVKYSIMSADESPLQKSNSRMGFYSILSDTSKVEEMRLILLLSSHVSVVTFTSMLLFLLLLFL